MVEESHMRRVLELVWNATLQLSVEEWTQAGALPNISGMLAGYVRISGAWEGTVAIHAPRALALRATALMFNLPESSITDADLRDAYGELANQVGGNLKVLLPQTCRLSLPTVTDGKSFVSHIQHPELLLKIAAQSCGMPVVVSMVEALPSRAALQARFHALQGTPN